MPEQELRDRVMLITGANAGIGRATALELARRGAHLLCTCRSREKAEATVQALRAESGNQAIEPFVLDLGDFDSVRACAAAVLARDLPLHVLINNAGLAGGRGLTASGFELAFGANHMGHFLLTKLLLDRIRQSAPARIVTVASQAHRQVRRLDFDALRKPTRSATGTPEYGVSKLANVLFSAELARRLEGSGVHCYSLHPGVVASDIWRRLPGPARFLVKLFMLSPEQGAQTSLYCATSPACAEQTGLYYDRCAARTPSALARDPELAKRLWSQSEAWVG